MWRIIFCVKIYHSVWILERHLTEILWFCIHRKMFTTHIVIVYTFEAFQLPIGHGHFVGRENPRDFIVPSNEFLSFSLTHTHNEQFSYFAQNRPNDTIEMSYRIWSALVHRRYYFIFSFRLLLWEWFQSDYSCRVQVFRVKMSWKSHWSVTSQFNSNRRFKILLQNCREPIWFAVQFVRK